MALSSEAAAFSVASTAGSGSLVLCYDDGFCRVATAPTRTPGRFLRDDHGFRKASRRHELPLHFALLPPPMMRPAPGAAGIMAGPGRSRRYGRAREVPGPRAERGSIGSPTARLANEAHGASRFAITATDGWLNGPDRSA